MSRSRTRIFHPSVSQICPKHCLDRLGTLGGSNDTERCGPTNRNRAICPTGWIIPENLGRLNGAARPPFGQNLGLRDSGSDPHASEPLRAIGIFRCRGLQPARFEAMPAAHCSLLTARSSLTRHPRFRCSVLTAHQLTAYANILSAIPASR